MSPKELAEKTIKDIAIKKKRTEEGKKQAKDYSFQNIEKTRRRNNGR
jgi:hypothetical protein